MFGSMIIDTLAPSSFTVSCKSTTSLDHRSSRRSTNLHKVLSLESETAGADEIKTAYRKMARRCHPDVCPPSRKAESTRIFLELRHAYETLSDPVARRRYDSELRMRGGKEGGEEEFNRETWEAQLQILRERSDKRMKAARS